MFLIILLNLAGISTSEGSIAKHVKGGEMQLKKSNGSMVENLELNLLRLDNKTSIDPVINSLSSDGLLIPEDQIKKDQPGYCRRQATCQPLNFTECYGVRLPYSFTTLDLISDVHSQFEVQLQLQKWQMLQSIPKCWMYVQPLLCAVYMPKCDGSYVDLPSHEMCKLAHGPCKIVQEEYGWPEFLQCNNETKFPHHCKNDVRELKFNTTSVCKSPLVSTKNPLSYFDGIDGCGLQCHNPLFDEQDHKRIHKFISIMGGLCLACTGFTVATFLIDWRAAKKYPAVIVFYINFCFFMVSVGWMSQFFPNARQDIVCRRDGTLRRAEPSSGENFSCAIIFFLVYYFLMAGFIWFVILAYSWHLSFKALGKIRENVNEKASHFHLVTWTVPLVMSITLMSLSEVDGNSISGICFVGYFNLSIRVGFVLVPLTVVVIAGGFFLLRGLITLIRLKIGSSDIVSQSASAKLMQTTIRMSVFTLAVFTLVIITYVCHAYDFMNQARWDSSLRDYVLCVVGTVEHVEHKECRLSSKPSLVMIELHLFSMFGSGVILSSWVWTKATLDCWKKYFRRKFDSNSQPEPIKLKKHKMIALAFAKRQELYNGRLSISFHSTHEDPLGLNFELNSTGSQEFSSTWGAAIPRFVMRRGALAGPGLGLRRTSIDSSVSHSYSHRRWSFDSRLSRRHSFDSQMSIRVSDSDRLNLFRGLGSLRTERRIKRLKRGKFGRSKIAPVFRRASITSQESNLESQQGSEITSSFIKSLKLPITLKGDATEDSSDADQCTKLLKSSKEVCLPPDSTGLSAKADQISDDIGCQNFRDGDAHQKSCEHHSEEDEGYVATRSVMVGTDHNHKPSKKRKKKCHLIDMATQTSFCDLSYSLSSLSSHEEETNMPKYLNKSIQVSPFLGNRFGSVRLSGKSSGRYSKPHDLFSDNLNIDIPLGILTERKPSSYGVGETVLS